MASLMRLLLIRHSFQLKCHTTFYEGLSRTLFVSRSPEIHHYLRRKKNEATATNSKLDEIKKNLEEIVKNQSIDNVGKDAIYYMIKMATTNSDIDLIVKALKSASIPPKEQGHLRQDLTDVLFYLRNVDKALELFKDKELHPFLMNQNYLYRLFFMLMKDKRFADIVDVFETFAAYRKLENYHQDYPDFILLVKALYLMNTKEALEKAKSIVDRLVVTNINKYKSNKKLNDQSRRIKPLPMAYIFMLAINQNDAEFAFQICSLCSPLEHGENNFLYQNLKIIALAKLNRTEQSLNTIETFLNVKDPNNFGYKKFFPYTIQCAKEAVNSDKAKSSELGEKLKLLENQIVKANELNEEDLPDLLVKFNYLESTTTTNASSNASSDQTFVRSDDKNTKTRRQMQKTTEPVVAKTTLSSSSSPQPSSSQNKRRSVDQIDETKNTNQPEQRVGNKSSADLMLLKNLIELYNGKKYERLVSLFEKTVLQSTKATSQLINNYVCESSLSIVTNSLLQMNSKESLAKMKSLLEFFVNKNARFSDDSKMHLFFLALNQNDPYYALGFISSSGIEKTNVSLFKNLKSIVLCKLNNPKGALNELDEIFKIELNKFANVGVIFPYTLKVLKETTKEKNLSQRLDEMQARLLNNNRLSHVDLFEICCNNTTALTLHQSASLQNVDRDNGNEEKAENRKIDPKEKLKKLFYSKEYSKYVNEFRWFFKNGNSGVGGEANLLKNLGKSILLSKLKIVEMKELLGELKTYDNLKLSCNFYVDIFFSIINQGDPLFALEFIADFDRNEFLKKEHTAIYSNILAIGFSLIDRLDVAFKQVETILEMDPSLKPDDKFHGKLFPKTFNCLKESTIRLNKDEFVNKYKILNKSAIENRRIANLDLDSLPDI